MQENIIKIDQDQKCTWFPNNHANDPHLHEQYNPNPQKIYHNILEVIGNTPLVRLNKIPKEEGLKSEILVKCEYLNPGGSIKDRIAYRMIEDAEKTNKCKPGDTLIEATSGNTGIGLGMTAAVKGYNLIITLPEHNSNEKMDLMIGLGANLIKTPAYVSHESDESNLHIAKDLNKQVQNSHILDQYSNPSNPLAHYDGTAEELLYQCDNHIDYLFMPAGTGGSLTGIARKFKEKIPKCKIIGIDPMGSTLALPAKINGPLAPYRVEGIGYDFIPRTLDRSVIDEWVKTRDVESFLMARRLISEEGLLVGGSSGACLAGAIKYAKEHNLSSNDRIVVILPDSIRNYMTKFLSKDWMINCGYISNKEYLDQNHPLYGMDWRTLKPKSVEIYDEAKLTVEKALDLFNKEKVKVIPLQESDSNEKLSGVIWPNKLAAAIVENKLKLTDSVRKAIQKDGFVVIEDDIDLCQIERYLVKNSLIFIKDRQQDKANNKRLYIFRNKEILKALNLKMKN